MMSSYYIKEDEIFIVKCVSTSFARYQENEVTGNIPKHEYSIIIQVFSLTFSRLHQS